MVYAAFSIYLLGILFLGRGIYRLWADLVRPAVVNWALLPGTVVSEMAYIFGCLITGGEVRRAKLIDTDGSSKSAAGDASEPTTEAAPRLRVVGPIIAAFASILACGACLLLAHWPLGRPMTGVFENACDAILGRGELLPARVPTSVEAFWGHLHAHVNLIRAMGRTCLSFRRLDWRAPLFVYLATCLSVRLAPVRRSFRATLAAIVATAGIIALLGLWDRFHELMVDLWPLVSYVWSLLLALLALTLAIRGVVALLRALIGKEPAGR